MYFYFSIYIFGSAAIHSHNRLHFWVDQILQPDLAYAGTGASFLLLKVTGTCAAKDIHIRFHNMLHFYKVPTSPIHTVADQRAGKQYDVSDFENHTM